MTSVLAARPRDALLVYGSRLAELFGVDAAREIVADASDDVQYLAGRCAQPARLVDLERRWYASLDSGAPAFDVYSSPTYLAEAWACWIIYARKYIAELGQPAKCPPGGVLAALAPIRRVVDLGCGIAYSTAALAQLLPGADVFGTNVDDAPQTRFGQAMGEHYGFKIVATPAAVGPVDVVFASEYFEHFPAPVEHLVDVLDVCSPRALIVANTFAQASIGHFPAYWVHGRQLDGPATSRAFSAELRTRGYRKLPARLWNNRPTIWTRPGT